MLLTGNLLDIPQGILMHQVNCQGIMGSGIAKQIKDKWPQVFQEYQNWIDVYGKYECLGKLQLIRVETGLWIANSFSQFTYGRDPYVKYTNERALIENIRDLSNIARECEKEVYAPYKIGCGLGNGDWDNIKPILETYNVNIVRLKDEM